MKTTILTTSKAPPQASPRQGCAVSLCAPRAAGLRQEHGDEPESAALAGHGGGEHGGMCQDAMIVETLQGMIDQDRKHTALKAAGHDLAGRLPQQGFHCARVSRCRPATAALARRGHKLAGVFVGIGGRAEAADFGNSDAGDLLPLFERSSTPKSVTSAMTDSTCSSRIDESLHGDILFLSECSRNSPARDAGCARPCWTAEDYPQPRTSEEATHGHPRFDSFAGIQP